jgi:hypothetical protein
VRHVELKGKKLNWELSSEFFSEFVWNTDWTRNCLLLPYHERKVQFWDHQPLENRKLAKTKLLFYVTRRWLCLCKILLVSTCETIVRKNKATYVPTYLLKNLIDQRTILPNCLHTYLCELFKTQESTVLSLAFVQSKTSHHLSFTKSTLLGTSLSNSLI